MYIYMIHIYDTDDIDLYRDDGLACFKIIMVIRTIKLGKS